MSRYLNSRLSVLEPYVPGEQPKDGEYIKLNTNENPYFPSKYAVKAIGDNEKNALRLYSDPECVELCNAIADFYGVDGDNVLPTNGSDEALAFCFAAFGERGALFPDVTYGFYKVFAGLFGVDYKEIPLDSDFNVDITPYLNCNKAIFLANPNAQTGVCLERDKIVKIIESNPRSVVVVDEAYVDFGGESCVPLTQTYDNLIVVQTFSKSRSLAGARVGFAIANKNLIGDLKRVKYSFNPYNVNRLSCAVAAEAMRDKEYFFECVERIKLTRAKLISGLKDLGFEVLPSRANFVLARSGKTAGAELYEKLKQRGVLVRHFSDKRIENFVRITVGTDNQTDILLKEIKDITEEKQ